MSVDVGHTPANGKRAHVDRRVGMMMGFIAATLAAGSFVHLAGYTPKGTKPRSTPAMQALPRQSSALYSPPAPSLSCAGRTGHG